MPEPIELKSARAHLAQAEAGYSSKDGLFHLEEGLALLEEVAVDGVAEHRSVAENLLSRYATKICESIKRAVETDRALAEPELEHLFKVLLAFDAGELELPAYVRSLKVEVVKRLIDLYYEGYPAEDKRKALEQLAGIAKEPLSPHKIIE